MAGRKKTREKKAVQSAKLESKQFWEVLFLAIATQGMSLAEFCKLEDVSYNVVSKRLKTDLDLQAEYTHARTERASYHANMIEKLSDEVLKNPKDANAYKISIDSKKWLASVMDRQTFGDKLDQTVSVDINLNATYLDQLKNLMTDKPKIIGESKKDCKTIEHKG